MLKFGVKFVINKNMNRILIVFLLFLNSLNLKAQDFDVFDSSFEKSSLPYEVSLKSFETQGENFSNEVSDKFIIPALSKEHKSAVVQDKYDWFCWPVSKIEINSKTNAYLIGYIIAFPQSDQGDPILTNYILMIYDEFGEKVCTPMNDVAFSSNESMVTEKSGKQYIRTCRFESLPKTGLMVSDGMKIKTTTLNTFVSPKPTLQNYVLEETPAGWKVSKK